MIFLSPEEGGEGVFGQEGGGGLTRCDFTADLHPVSCGSPAVRVKKAQRKLPIKSQI